MGRLIAIEGIDGTGKGTQTKRLHQALMRRGFRVYPETFPKYNVTFHGMLVGEYLNGDFGKMDEIHPFLAAMLFAGDRLEYRSMLLAGVGAFAIALLARYVMSNIRHQCGQILAAVPQVRSKLMQRILQLEYDIHKMPVPDVQILLDMPVELSAQLVAKKKGRDYTDRAADLHESDHAYQRRVREVYKANAIMKWPDLGLGHFGDLDENGRRTNLIEIPCYREDRGEVEEEGEITERILHVLERTILI